MVAALALPSAPPGLAVAAPTVTLTGTVLRRLSKLTALGPTDPGTPVTLGIGLAHPNDAQEEAYLESLYTPADPLYEQFLDPDTYQQQFGVPQASLDAVTGWLRTGGLNVTTLPGTTDYALATGTAGQVAQLLNVTFSNFSVDGAIHYATTVDPSVPATLGIEAIAGLDNVQGPRLIPHSTSTSAQAPSATPSVPPQIGLTTPQSCGTSTISQPPTKVRASRWPSSAGA
jgi:subtilase family serine protease